MFFLIRVVIKDPKMTFKDDRAFLQSWWNEKCEDEKDKRKKYLWELIVEVQLFEIEIEEIDDEDTVVMEGDALKHMFRERKKQRDQMLLFYYIDDNDENKYYIFGIYEIDYNRPFPTHLSIFDLKEDIYLDPKYELNIDRSLSLLMYANDIECPPFVIKEEAMCALLKALYEVGIASEEDYVKKIMEVEDKLFASSEFELVYIWIMCSVPKYDTLKTAITTAIPRIFNTFRHKYCPYEHDIIRLLFKKKRIDYKLSLLTLEAARQEIDEDNVAYLEKITYNGKCPRYIFRCALSHASVLIASSPRCAILHNGAVYFTHASIEKWMVGRWSETCYQHRINPDFYWKRAAEFSRDSVILQDLILACVPRHVKALEAVWDDITRTKSLISSSITESIWEDVPLMEGVDFVTRYKFFLPYCIINPIITCIEQRTHLKFEERKIVFMFLRHVGIPLRDAQEMWFDMCKNDPSLKLVLDFNRFITSDSLGIVPSGVYKFQETKRSSLQFMSCESIQEKSTSLCPFTDIEDLGTRKMICASSCNKRDYTFDTRRKDSVTSNDIKYWSPRVAFKFMIGRSKSVN